MIQIRQTLLAAFLFISLVIKAQKKEPVLFLKEGRIKTAQNITDASVENFNSKAPRHRDKTFAVLQFESLPTTETRKLLSKQGVELLEYIPENAYTVSITGKLNAGLLKRVGARTILQPSPKQKMHPAMAKGEIPDWARKVKDKVDVWVSFPRVYTAAEVAQYLEEQKMEVRSSEHGAYRILEVRLPLELLDALASFPFIEYVEPVPPEPQPLNQNSRNGARAGVLHASVADGGRGLNGEGVVIGIGDDGDVQSHADLNSSRLINKVMGLAAYHATHVTTTAAGGGIVNEYYKGYAPKATVISESWWHAVNSARDYVRDYGMVLTSNSYGTGGNYGEYNLSSRMVDQQAFDFPHLQHVYAAGNDGGKTNGSYPAGYHTVFGACQAAKNVISVGGTEWTGALWNGSSRGPVQDGRLKPEITAQAAAVTSGALNSGYGTYWGTSMASPAVTGGLALLYQRYRQLNGGANPKNGLMKALLCNGGADLGNAGPDFSYGYGWMNLLRSMEMIEKEQYKTDSITTGVARNYTITVPANTAQVKVMLYWNDPATSLLTSQALVNDLDLTVSDPSLAVHLPRVLDTATTGLLNVATTGVDHINNMEQVVIDNPTPGTYTINVSGMVAQNPTQEYYVVYDIIPVSVTLTNPVGGQAVAPGEKVQINWDSYGDPATTFALRYSTDNGATWTDINASIPATARRYEWTVPNAPTTQALVHIGRNGTGLSHTTQPFTIIGVPVLSLAPVQCEGYMALTWTPVTGAAGYEVMMKRDDEMVPVATTTATAYTLNSLSPDSLYWVSVRARIGEKPGRRAVAVSRQPNSGTCAGTISDGDLKLDAVVSPTVGRKYTSSELSNACRVTIRVKNLDDVPVTGFVVKYSLNSKEWITETVGATIGAGATYNHTFAPTEDLSAPGHYSLVAVVDNNNPDLLKANDTLMNVVRQLDNHPLDLSTPFVDDLESAAAAVYTKDFIGLDGIDRYDFSDSSTHGLLNTYVSQSAFSGTKSLVLGSNAYYGTPTGVEYVTGTYNLNKYDANLHDIRLRFKAVHSVFSNAGNKLWARGNEAQNWIELLNLNSYSGRNFMDIEVGDLLAKHGQNFSSSFQLRWSNDPSQYNFNLALDDIIIYEVVDDMQVLNFNAAVNLSCSNESLQITIRNSSIRELTNVPVRFRIDSGAWVTEIIPTIAPGTTLPYKFTTPFSFTAPGAYNLTMLVDFPTDNVRKNDTLVTMVNYASSVTTFPYLQDFESGPGGWYTVSSDPAWEFGTPASLKINKAASGVKAWKANKPGNPNDEESSMLYSPCFEIGGMANPMLSFSMAMDLQGCNGLTCEAAWVEYSIDNKPWEFLMDDSSAGINWYKMEGLVAWGEQKPRWHVVTTGLPKNAGTIRFRISSYREPGINTEGIAIDDIHVYDGVKPIYDGVSPGLATVKPVSGSGWVDFESEGKLIASINPNGQDLGTTEVQAFIYSGPVRYTSRQYYHDRNITIKPAITALADSATVRLYFLDSETEQLIGATGCSGCLPTGSAYDLGISKYSDGDRAKENGEVCDDSKSNNWSFIPRKEVAIVPFQKGYYAEFKVKDFSEFWLNNGGTEESPILSELVLPSFDPVQIIAPGVSLAASPAGGTWSGPGVSGTLFSPASAGIGTHTLTYTYINSDKCSVMATTTITVVPAPEKLLTFTAEKLDRDVVTKWSTEYVTSIVRYEIEVSAGEADLAAGRFVRIGEVAGRSNLMSMEHYTFIDTEVDKFGVRKYRLRMIHADGSVTYSDVAEVQFPDAVTWQVYPNPSPGIFNLFVRLAATEELKASVYDSKGVLVKQYHTGGTGVLQKIVIDLSAPSYASGIYILQTVVNGKRKHFKLHKL